MVSTFLPPLTNDRSAAALGRLFGGQSGVNGGATSAPDGSNINPVALALLNFKLPNGHFAIPNPQTILASGVGESTFSIPAKFQQDRFTVNVDHKVSEKNQLSGRFFYSREPTEVPFNSFAATVPGFGGQQTYSTKHALPLPRTPSMEKRRRQMRISLRDFPSRA
jgi:hypothetical protein